MAGVTVVARKQQRKLSQHCSSEPQPRAFRVGTVRGSVRKGVVRREGKAGKKGTDKRRGGREEDRVLGWR